MDLRPCLRRLCFIGEWAKRRSWRSWRASRCGSEASRLRKQQRTCRRRSVSTGSSGSSRWPLGSRRKRMVDLSGRRGLIAGISGENSFGFSCARAMVEMGAKITVTSRPQRAEECRRLAESLGCAHLSLDADDERSMDAAFAQLEAVEPRLDFVVHTMMSAPAGVLDRPLLELTR